ncbi:lysozyme [Methylobacter marinus]|uniref:lysozyme n=1 Tax=Methylobacter marinus TaxID=34058 RepID=UPI00037B9C1E|nr:lysozyme [Methylobacter marinus]
MNTNNPTTVTAACADLIKASESLKLVAYLCPSNRLTIGYGHVLMPAWDAKLFRNVSTEALARIVSECQRTRIVSREYRSRLRIAEDQADHLLFRDVAQTALFLRSVTPVALSQHQFDALVSFIFNVGQGNYATSTLRKKLHAGDYTGAAAEFDRWIYGTVNGKKQKLNGLITRRATERALFEGNSQ